MRSLVTGHTYVRCFAGLFDETCTDKLAPDVQLPPVDNQLVSMKIVTPANGTLLLSKDDPEQLPIFNLAKVHQPILWVSPAGNQLQPFLAPRPNTTRVFFRARFEFLSAIAPSDSSLKVQACLLDGKCTTDDPSAQAGICWLPQG